MTKEYLSKYIGYYCNRVTDGEVFEDRIILIRKEWYIPNTTLKFSMSTSRKMGFTTIHGSSQCYRDALAKVEEYFDGK
jgi:hypothetical protein